MLWSLGYLVSFLPIRLARTTPADPRNERISLQIYSEVTRFYVQLLLNAAQS